MTFSIIKVSNYGTSHPVVARLLVQTSELLGWADLIKEDRDKVFDVYNSIKNRLLKCHESYDRLRIAFDKNLDKTSEKMSEDKSDRFQKHPFLIGLQAEIETILYESKNYLRDLLQVLNIFFITNFSESHAYYDTKSSQESSIALWAKKQFGKNDNFYKMLISEQKWIEEIIRKRNAVEHPGGHSGRLHIINFQQMPDGRFMAPVWHRDDLVPTGIFPDLDVMLDNLLTLAEDILVSCLHHKSKFPGMIAFAEIAEGERPSDCPVRIRVVPGEKIACSLAQRLQGEDRKPES